MKRQSAPKLRPNVCMLVCNTRGQLLLGERIDEAGHWQFPQGGVERGASLRENVYRELREELGIKRKHIRKLTKLKARNSYLWSAIPAYARGKWVGQSQTFWIVDFIGEDSDIDLESSEEQEFQDWRWCSVATVRRIAARRRVAGYEAALREFVELRK